MRATKKRMTITLPPHFPHLFLVRFVFPVPFLVFIPFFPFPFLLRLDLRLGLRLDLRLAVAILTITITITAVTIALDARRIAAGALTSRSLTCTHDATLAKLPSCSIGVSSRSAMFAL